MKITRTLSNGDVLTVTQDGGRYSVHVSSDTANQGFEGDNGTIREGETLEGITDELELWMGDNINE